MAPNPTYKLIEKKDGYELREYDESIWFVSIMTEGYKKSVKNGFFRMWAFIGGKNEKKKKLEMTAPVRNRPQADDENSFEISLMAPPGYKEVEDVPIPKEKELIEIRKEPKVIRAVIGPFGGRPGKDEYKSKVEELKKLLERDGIKMADPPNISYSGFSPPFVLMKRRQEVWIDVVVEGTPTDADQ